MFFGTRDERIPINDLEFLYLLGNPLTAQPPRVALERSCSVFYYTPLINIRLLFICRWKFRRNVSAGVGAGDDGAEDVVSEDVVSGDVVSGDVVSVVAGHSNPKSGHVTPEKYNPSTTARTSEQQPSKMMIIITAVSIVLYNDYISRTFVGT